MSGAKGQEFDPITEDVATALSELVSKAESVGELAHRDGYARAVRELQEARAECEREIRAMVATRVRHLESDRALLDSGTIRLTVATGDGHQRILYRCVDLRAAIKSAMATVEVRDAR